MIDDAMLEIGGIIHVQYKLIPPRRLTPVEIFESYEYKMFRKKYPNLCRLVEGD